MGVQLHIKNRDMVAAGWTRVHEPYTYLDEDMDGNTITAHDVHMYYKRGDALVATYSPTDFCWDSNTWGDNRARHEQLGLLDIPHELY